MSLIEDADLDGQNAQELLSLGLDRPHAALFLHLIDDLDEPLGKAAARVGAEVLWESFAGRGQRRSCSEAAALARRLLEHFGSPIPHAWRVWREARREEPR